MLIFWSHNICLDGKNEIISSTILLKLLYLLRYSSYLSLIWWSHWLYVLLNTVCNTFLMIKCKNRNVFRFIFQLVSRLNLTFDKSVYRCIFLLFVELNFCFDCSKETILKSKSISTCDDIPILVINIALVIWFPIHKIQKQLIQHSISLLRFYLNNS